MVVGLLRQLVERLDEAPDDPNLRRLSPPAYLDDPEADAGYQLLAGEELRSSHREAVDAVVASLERSRATEGELWAWLRSLNSVRLVLGTILEISTDDEGPPDRKQLAALPEEEQALWSVYEFCTILQYEVVRALR